MASTVSISAPVFNCAANRLSVVHGSPTTIFYRYNGLGDRVSRRVFNGVTNVITDYTNDIAAGLTQVLADNDYYYLYGNGRIAQYSTRSFGRDIDYFITDALGSVRQLVDYYGEVTLAKGYEPFGETLESAGEGKSDFAFTGEAVEAMTGYVYLRARFMDPAVGRFTSRDVWQGDYYQPASYNSWLYGYANPIKFVDPSGYYNRLATREFAMAYDHVGPISGYYDFSQDNWGDCTSFVSFALWNGGIRDPRYNDDVTPRDLRIEPYMTESMKQQVKERRRELGLLPGKPFWHRELWKSGEDPFVYYASNAFYPDSANLDLQEWYRTDNLLSFLQNNFATVSLEYGGTIPNFDDTNVSGGKENEDWVRYLQNNRFNIRHGDLVFYDWQNVDNGTIWDHVAIVIGWGPQTYYSPGYIPKRRCRLEYIKPRVVDRGASENSGRQLYNDFDTSRSIDNTQSDISKILILHIR